MDRLLGIDTCTDHILLVEWGRRILFSKAKTFFFRFDKMTNRYFDLLSIDP